MFPITDSAARIYAMRRYLIALAAVVLCLPSVEAFSQQLPSDAEIKAAIARLGEETDSEGFDKFEILYKNSRRSTELLIATLKPIRRGQYVEGKHPQVVWNIRALRSLTGLNFRGPTRADLTEYEAHFLDHDPTTDEVNFFGTWMSRDRVWVAPLDAQTTIIKKWQTWFREHGQSFKYVNDRNSNDWYF
jgi:hypothetical protein